MPRGRSRSWWPKKLRPSCPFRDEARKRTPNRSPRLGARRKNNRMPAQEKIPGPSPNRAEEKMRSPARGKGKLDGVPRDVAEGVMERKIPARELANAAGAHAGRQPGPIPGPRSLPEGDPEAEASQTCPKTAICFVTRIIQNPASVGYASALDFPCSSHLTILGQSGHS